MIRVSCFQLAGCRRYVCINTFHGVESCPFAYIEITELTFTRCLSILDYLRRTTEPVLILREDGNHNRSALVFFTYT